MNEALRAHVTDTAFHLALRKTHIAALVYLDWVIAVDEGYDNNPEWVNEARHRFGYATPYRHAFTNFHIGARGLIERGLVEHVAATAVEPMRDPGWTRRPFREAWRITRAGELVLDLLREAGIYQEFAADTIPNIPHRPVKVSPGQQWVSVKGEAG